MSKDNGGPAFPTPDTHHPNGQVQYGSNGMTLRDWFAVKLLHQDIEGYPLEFAESLLGRKCPAWANDPAGTAAFWAEFRAKLRYMEADAMIQEREK